MGGKRIEHQALLALVKQKERFSCQVLKRYPRFGSQWMVEGHQRHHLVVIDHTLVKTCFKTPRGKAKIDRTIVHPLGVARVIALLKGKVHVRMQSAETADDARKHGAAHVGEGCYADVGRRQAQQLLALSLKLGLGRHDLAQVGQILLPIARKRDALLAPLQNRGAQLAFERLDRLADRALRVAQLVGRRLKAPAIDHRADDLIP